MFVESAASSQRCTSAMSRILTLSLSLSLSLSLALALALALSRAPSLSRARALSPYRLRSRAASLQQCSSAIQRILRRFAGGRQCGCVHGCTSMRWRMQAQPLH